MKKHILTLALALLALSSCHRKDYDEYYQIPPAAPGNPPIENPGQIVVIPNTPEGLPDTPEGTPPPAPSIADITVTGPDGKPVTIDPNTPTDVESGTYTATIVSVVPDLTTDAKPGTDISTLPPATQTNGGTIVLPTAEDGELPNLPQVYAGIGTATVETDARVTARVDQHPMTRAVQVEGLLQGIEPNKLQSITVKLEGVSRERAINNPYPVEKPAGRGESNASTRAGEGTYYVSSTLAEVNTTDWVNIFRLLGLAQHQTLSVVVHYKDTTIPPYTYLADVTPMLENFNTGHANKPAILRVVLNFGVDNVTGKIEGWTPGWDEDTPGE